MSNSRKETKGSISMSGGRFQDGQEQMGSRPGGDGSPVEGIDVSRPYHIAGIVVACFHSRYHHLVGTLVLHAAEGSASLVRVDPDKLKAQDDGRTLKEVGQLVLAERDMLIMAGRQAELIHYTLHTPAESDEVIGQLNKQMPRRDGVNGRDGQLVISQALALVTHHWHEIECLAAWLTKQHTGSVSATDMERQIAGILPGDHGLFP